MLVNNYWGKQMKTFLKACFVLVITAITAGSVFIISYGVYATAMQEMASYEREDICINKYVSAGVERANINRDFRGGCYVK